MSERTASATFVRYRLRSIYTMTSRRVRLRSHGNYKNYRNSDLKRLIVDRAREGEGGNDSKSTN